MWCVCVRERETRTEREREVGEEGEREAERRAEKDRARKEQSGGSRGERKQDKGLPTMQFIQGSRTPQGQQVVKDPCGAKHWSFLLTQARSVRHPKFLSVGVRRRVTLWALRSHGSLSRD